MLGEYFSTLLRYARMTVPGQAVGDFKPIGISLTAMLLQGSRPAEQVKVKLLPRRTAHVSITYLHGHTLRKDLRSTP